MKIQITNDLLNLATLQSKMDQTVFDYVDTTQNWQKAYSILDDLLHQMANNFNQHVANNKGGLPKDNTYWVLFMVAASKLIYFNGLTHVQLIDLQDEEAKNHIVELYKKSAICLPNAIAELNNEFLEELKASLLELVPLEEHECVELTVGSSMNECLAEFYELTKTYE